MEVARANAETAGSSDSGLEVRRRKDARAAL